MTKPVPATRPSSWLKRVGWLALIWAASMAALGVVTYALKGLMRLAGLAS